MHYRADWRWVTTRLEAACQQVLFAIGSGRRAMRILVPAGVGTLLAAPTVMAQVPVVSSPVFGVPVFQAPKSSLSFSYIADNASNNAYAGPFTVGGPSPNTFSPISSGTYLVTPSNPAHLPLQYNHTFVATGTSGISLSTAEAGVYEQTDSTTTGNMAILLAAKTAVTQTDSPGDLFQSASEMDISVNAEWTIGNAAYPVRAGYYPGVSYEYPIAGTVGIDGSDHVIINLSFIDTYLGTSTTVGTYSEDLAENNSTGTASLPFTQLLTGTVMLNQGKSLPAGSNFQIEGTITFKAKNDLSPSNVFLPQNGAVVFPQLTASQWQSAGGASWSGSSNWTMGVPNNTSNNAPNTAIFGSSISGPSTVTLDGDQSVSAVTFDTTGTASYTIAPGTGGSLILDGGLSPAAITNQGGNHSISAPLVLNSNTFATVSNYGDTLAFSGGITGTGSLTISGQGTVILSGNANVSVGTINVNTSVNPNDPTESQIGSLQIGDFASAPTVSGQIMDNGLVVFDLPVVTEQISGISGTGGVTVNSGIVQFTSPNTFAGSLTINGGEVEGVGTVGGAGAVILNGGALEIGQSGASFTSLSGSGDLDTTGPISIGNVSDDVFSGRITGGNTLTKTGLGTLTLNGPESTPNATIVSAGTLLLDYSSTTSPIIARGSSLTLTGATLQINGNNNSNSVITQNWTGTTVTSGPNFITLPSGTGGPVVLNLSSVVAPSQGTTIQFKAPVNTSNVGGFIQVNGSCIQINNIPPGILATNNGGYYSGYATFGAYDWAITALGINGASYILPGSAVSGFYTEQEPSNSITPNVNTDIVGVGEFAAPQNSTAISIRFNTPSGGQFNYGGNNLDQLLVNPSLACGAYLITPNVGPNNVLISDQTQASAGQSSVATEDLTAGRSTSAAQDLVMWQNNTEGLVILDTGIADTAFPGGGFTKAGPGTVVLNATSSYTGTTNIEGGMVEIPFDAALGGLSASSTLGPVFLNIGTLMAVSTLTLDSGGALPVARNVMIGPYGGSLIAARGETLTVDGSISDSPAGDGTLLFGATGTISVATANTTSSAVNATSTYGDGKVILSRGLNLEPAIPIAVAAGTLQIGDGVTTSTLDLGNNGVADNGTLTFDQTSNGVLAVSNPISGIGGVSQIGPGSTLTLSGFNTYEGQTTITAGTLNITGAGALPAGGNVVNNGLLVIAADSNAGNITGTGMTNVAGSASLVAANFSQSAVVDSGAIQVTGNGTVGNIIGNGSLTVGTGSSNSVLQIASQGATNVLSSLTIVAGSTVDITNNIVEINYGSSGSPLSIIRAAIISGYHDGAWNGIGILSSAAAANSAYALGYADGTVDTGTAAAPNQVLIRYTLIGDANLDGVVNLTDLLALLNNYGQTGRDWSQGDFNYDGSTNLTDLLALLNNYDQSVNLTATNSSDTGETAAVPEPTKAAFLMVSAAGLLRCRRAPNSGRRRA